MQSGAFLDYHEVLHLSPNADAETIHRVFRMLAQRYHPDNLITAEGVDLAESSPEQAPPGVSLLPPAPRASAHSC